MFGVGWGLVGWCPGPAISSIALMHLETFVFVAAMVAGMVFQRLLPLAPSAGRSAAAQR